MLKLTKSDASYCFFYYCVYGIFVPNTPNTADNQGGDPLNSDWPACFPESVCFGCSFMSLFPELFGAEWPHRAAVM